MQKVSYCGIIDYSFSGWSMDRLSKRDWLVVAFFAFVTLGTALVILNWLLGWY
jgi:hypothetical protein